MTSNVHKEIESPPLRTGRVGQISQAFFAFLSAGLFCVLVFTLPILFQICSKYGLVSQPFWSRALLYCHPVWVIWADGQIEWNIFFSVTLQCIHAAPGCICMNSMRSTKKWAVTFGMLQVVCKLYITVIKHLIVNTFMLLLLNHKYKIPFRFLENRQEHVEASTEAHVEWISPGQKSYSLKKRKRK